ncbi:MAG: polyprenyl synthetase family protein [Hyphomicrobiaceae bacterium]
MLVAARLGQPPERLVAAMRHAVLGSGKRFRPFLVLESAALMGVPVEDALDTAAAVELLHCYSLVHDDLPAMDDDDLRRGRPTVHRAFDEATAILAGDGLLTLAFEVLAGEAARRGPEIVVALVAGLARAAGVGGMVGGQQLDLDAEAQRGLGLGDIYRIQALKTGALIRFSAEAGAILAAGGADDRAALGTYGEALGLAFQISDDLLDVEGDAAAVGKATGKDAAVGKATYVSLLGVGGARHVLSDVTDEALAALDRFGSRADVLRAAVRFVAERDR